MALPEYVLNVSRAMHVPLSVLDLAFVGHGQTARDAFAASVGVAQRAEELGYRRVWYAEHHNMATIASSATSVLIEHVASRTRLLGRAECHRPAIVEMEWAGVMEFAFRRQVHPPLAQALSYKLPPRVEESYREARVCYGARAHIATAVMVRRTLEAVARQFSQERVLAQGLRETHAQGVISNELASWGDELRFLGNVGARPTDQQVTDVDAQEAIEFLEAIVETIYASSGESVGEQSGSGRCPRA